MTPSRSFPVPTATGVAVGVVVVVTRKSIPGSLKSVTHMLLSGPLAMNWGFVAPVRLMLLPTFALATGSYSTTVLGVVPASTM